MKKIISLILCLTLIMALASCSVKTSIVNEEGTSETTTEEATIPEDFTEATEPETEEIPEEKNAEFYAGLYGLNICPFYINVEGNETKYFFRNGGNLINWTYSENNTDGWYYYNGLIISADGKYAIGPEFDDFSSFCSYEALPYDGETLTEEQQKEIKDGTLYTLNSFTPIATNWGIILDDDAETDDEFACMDIDCDFDKDEPIYLFTRIDIYDESPCNGEVLVFAHQDGTVYSGDITEELKATAITASPISNMENEPDAVINIPGEAVDASENGRFDIVLTYDGIITAYVVITVEK